MVDYIVVGLGIAGISFCEMLDAHKKSYVVINDDSQQSSEVAGGMYNPVILKRFTEVWLAREQLAMAKPFYNKLEKKLKCKLDHRIPVYRKFASVEEQNLWFEAADKPGLQPFMSTRIHKNDLPDIDAKYGFGEVLGTGRIDLATLHYAYMNRLIQLGKYDASRFDYTALSMNGDTVNYKNYKARHVVFCEGFGLKRNPYFNYLPLQGSKGELLTIYIPGFKMDFLLKSSVFLMPVDEFIFKVGATYDHADKSNLPTEKARQELLTKLETFLKRDYTVLEQVAGIRPTVADRRPLVGTHYKHKNLHVLNGFGSRGVMIAPYASKELYEHIENSRELNPEMNISRYSKRIPKADITAV